MTHVLFAAVWLVWLGVWIVAAFWSKRTVRREGVSGLAHRILLVAAYVMLFGLRGHRIFGVSAAWEWMGLALTVAGAGFGIWARLTIGRNWSAAVTIKEDHTLVREGPYRIVRHPIYSALLLAMLGTAIGYGTVTGWLSLPVAFAALWFKLRIEEGYMRAQFGQQYLAYKREVKALVPGVL
jgi:protein-S-isoprenylcysteine O-methyltransferase Ste14